MNHHRTPLLAALLFLLLPMACGGDAGEPPAEDLEASTSEIYNGTQSFTLCLQGQPCLQRNEVRLDIYNTATGKRSRCSGIAVNAYSVLTARHCFFDDATGADLRSTSTYQIVRGSTTTAVTSPLTQIEFAPTPSTLNHPLDVALITPDDLIPVTEDIRFYGGTKESLLNRQVTCMGYGADTYLQGQPATSTNPAVLRYASLLVENPATSGKTPSTPINQTTFPEYFYVATNASSQNLYFGDSGGPCYVTVDGDRYLAGVIQGGTYKSPASISQEYGKVTLSDSFAEWMAQKIYSSFFLRYADFNTTTFASPWEPFHVRSAYLNQDAKVDLLMAGDTAVRTKLASASPGGYFSATETTSNHYNGSGWSDNVQVADVDGDGLHDFVQTNFTNIRVRLSNGSGGFGTTKNTGFTSGGSDWNLHAFMVDVTGEKKADYVRTRDQEIIAKVSGANSNGPGTFGVNTSTPITSASSTDWSAGATFADVTGDGKKDWVFLGASQISVKQAVGDGTFGALQTSSVGVTGAGGQSSMVDVTGDGAADFVLVNPPSLWVKISNKDGTFGPAIKSRIEWGSIWMDTYQLTDINGDGAADFVGVSASSIYTKRSNKQGAFVAMQAYILDSAPPPPPAGIDPSYGWAAAAGFLDITGDGCNDFVFINESSVWVKPCIKMTPYGSGDVSTPSPASPSPFRFPGRP